MENKTPKPASQTGRYFKYAVGEILLVMVGILLALEVNNWNGTKQARLNEIKTLEQLNVDLKSNLLELKELDSLIAIRVKSGQKILAHFKNYTITTDSLKYWVERFNGVNIFNNANTTYRNLENSSNIIITNDSLRIRITLMYETEFANVHRREQMYTDRYANIFQKELRKNFKTDLAIYEDFDEVTYRINTPKNYTNLKSNEDFKSALVGALNFRILRISWLSKTKKKLKALIADLDTEIQRLK